VPTPGRQRTKSTVSGSSGHPTQVSLILTVKFERMGLENSKNRL
jgi:hypothetical protein